MITYRFFPSLTEWEQYLESSWNSMVPARGSKKYKYAETSLNNNSVKAVYGPHGYHLAIEDVP